MPIPSNKSKAPPKSPATEKNEKSGGGGFFEKMKRTLLNEPTHSSSSKDAPAPSTSKVVFGQPLAAVSDYGFVTSMIAGQRHDLPCVVFNAVEEIYRRGQGPKIPGLLHLAGEPGRIAKLVGIYDSAPDYGEHHDLSIESIHNVTSLLKKYLGELPDPVLDRRLWRLFIWSCVDSTAPLKQRVACAQIILRLLPAPNFSLLVYLIAFLSQMPLFPENRLTLDSVATIFGPLTMSGRSSGTSAAAKLNKLLSTPMIITGPTDIDSSVTVKKAQEALLWLLRQWSSIADGLLEPDFDIDVDAVLDRAPTTSRHRAASDANKAQPSLPETSTVPASPQEKLSTPVLQQQEQDDEPTAESTQYGETSTRSFPPPSPAMTLEILPQLSSTQKGDAGPSSSPYPASSPATGNISTPSSQHSHTLPATPQQTRMEKQPSLLGPGEHQNSSRVEPLEWSATDREQDDRFASSTESGDATGPTPQTSPARSSDSTIDSSISSARANDSKPPLLGSSKKVGRSDGLPRAMPEDQFGPLGGIPGRSVLDDLLQNDDFSRSSDPTIFNFPTPPSDYGSTFSPNLDGLKTGAKTSPRGRGTVFVRSQAEQLREAQQAQETQRREIQALWKQLTDNELARAAERNELETLRQEVVALRASAEELRASRDAVDDAREREQDDLRRLREEVQELREAASQPSKEALAMSAMEARCREAKRSMEEAREELRLVREEKEVSEREAGAQIASLKARLDSIRSVLSGASGSI